jgi:transcriptional regulator with XRE-family HTH domain
MTKNEKLCRTVRQWIWRGDEIVLPACKIRSTKELRMMRQDMTVAEKIKAARKNAEMTQEQLAGKTGISLMSIRRYEANERQIKIEQLQRIASALGVSLDSLLSSNAITNIHTEETVTNNFINAKLTQILLALDRGTPGDSSINYKALYFFLFNGIGDVIDKLKQLQYDAEERMLGQPDKDTASADG